LTNIDYKNIVFAEAFEFNSAVLRRSMLAIRTLKELSVVQQDVEEGFRLATTRFIGFSLSPRTRGLRENADKLLLKWHSRYSSECDDDGEREICKADRALLATTVDAFEKVQRNLAGEFTAFIQGASGHFSRRLARVEVDDNLTSSVRAISKMIDQFVILIKRSDNLGEIGEEFYAIHMAIEYLKTKQEFREAQRRTAVVRRQNHGVYA
jgi:hypothetical protein